VDVRVTTGWRLGKWLIAAAVAAMILLSVRKSLAQTPPEPKQPGFSVRKEDQAVLNAFDDFERYRDKSEWEKAFRALTTAADAAPKGMVPAKDGFLVPKSQRIRDLLTTLPPAGRDAYRLFNDPKARQQFDECVKAETEQGKVDAAALRKLVEQYFITATGDQAADRLGDLYFEAGDFLGAEAMWNAVLGGYPDSDLPPVRLHVKRAVALARAGRNDALAAAHKTIVEKYPGETLTLGGRTVNAADHVASLMKQVATTAPAARSDASVAAATPVPAPIDLPETDKPVWQIAFQDKDATDKIDAAFAQQGWGQQMGVYTKLVPPAATDGERLYANWLGVGFAADLKTGKLLWRTDKFADIGTNAQNFANYQRGTDRYETAAAGDRVLFVRLPLNRLNEAQAPYSLSCHAAADGKRMWTSESGALSNWSFVGQPIVVDGTAYATAHPRAGQELSLLAIALDGGKLEGSLLLGTPQSGMNYRGEQQMPIPTLLHHGGILYVLTNNGALLAVSRAGRRIEWALSTEGPPVSGGEQIFWGYPMPEKLDLPGELLVRGGTLYAKEAGGSVLNAIDLTGPSPALAWKRPLDAADTIAGMDDRFVYVLGRGLSAIELPSKSMKWSTVIPAATGSLRPIVANGAAYVLGMRGVYQVDTRTGDVTRIFRGSDRDAVGGALLVAGDKLITVSNTAITAYPLRPRDRQARSSAR
jgi:outer membrane protein assembly factor BamB